jgi:hypothetical protein
VKWRVLLELGGKHHAGQTSNIAYGGTLVDFAEPVDGASSGAQGYLTIGPTQNGVTVTLAVEERHRDDSSCKLGFSFCDLEGADGEVLEKLVAIAAASVVIEDR